MMITFGAPCRSRWGAPPAAAPGLRWDAPLVFERFTQRGREVVVRAQEVGRELGHPQIGNEHLLLGQLSVGEGLGAWALESLGVGRETALGAQPQREGAHGLFEAHAGESARRAAKGARSASARVARSSFFARLGILDGRSGSSGKRP